VPAAGPAASSAATSLQGPASLFSTLEGEGLPGEVPVRQVAPEVVKRLDRATQNGLLSEAERHELEDKFEELAEHPPAVQAAAVEKFIAPGLADLRWVVDKGGWLSRCLRFCIRTNSAELPPQAGSPAAGLIAALAAHGLLPDALTQECWDTYAAQPPELQQCIVRAMRISILANVTCRLRDHFLHIVRNERMIYELEDGPMPRVETEPEPLEWEAIDGTLYQRLLQQMLFKQRKSEERLLRELAEAEPHVKPGSPGSLLYLHAATAQARRQGSAEVLSVLHAAAASGLVRICARFIAEGLDVNECAGCQEFTPLHLAASHGEVEVVRLLLRQRADPNARDGEGHSALYGAISAAVHLRQRHGGDSGGVAGSTMMTHHSLQLKACNLLLLAGAENAPEGNFSNREPQSAASLAEENCLFDLRNLIRLHGRLRGLQQRFQMPDVAISELCRLQFETALFVVLIFERHMNVSVEAAPTEFRALISSDFIQARDQVQRLGNRLARRLFLSKRAVDALVDLPPAAGMHALRTWKIEEIIPRVYEVSEHLNAPQPPAPQPADAVGADPGAEAPDASRGREVGAAAEGRAGQPQGEPKLEGRVRKWDSERGFGFIVQDPREGEEVGMDIFVHRKNIVGSTPANHLDLKENCRISYRLGEQDGRPRALEATMIDADGNVLPIHYARSGDMDCDHGFGRDDALDITDHDDEDQVTRKFLRHLRSREVQEVVKEKRIEGESWLRCVGLRRHNIGRRDDSIWKKEIERRVDIFLEKSTTPLQKRDFDFRVRRFLHEFCVHSAVTRVSEALAMVEVSTAGKRRDEVRSWPAYLATLLRRFDPKLYEILADRDRRSRVEQRRVRLEASATSEAADSVIGDGGTLASVAESYGEVGDSLPGTGGDAEAPNAGAGSGDDRSSDAVSVNSSPRASSCSSTQTSHSAAAAAAAASVGKHDPLPSGPPSGAAPVPPRAGGATSGSRAAAPGLFAAAIRAAGVLPGGATAPAPAALVAPAVAPATSPAPRRTFQ